MQAAKDTFLKTLAGRLAAVNPQRTVTLDGTARPAVLAVENETAISGETLLQFESTAGLPAMLFEAFLLDWEAAGRTTPDETLMHLDCRVRYASKGTTARRGMDRGRIVTAMDLELVRIAEPRQAAKCDYGQNPPVALGSEIFWTRPVVAAVRDLHGMSVHEAAIRVFFFPEAM